MSALDPCRRTSGALNTEGTATAAAALGLPPSGGKVDPRAASTVVTGMLPTPAKTPSRKHSEQNAAQIQSIARNLFASDDDVMPSPRGKKRAKKTYTGLSMDSLTAVEDEASIKIYTDSHERIPEVDRSADNPFYGEHQRPQQQELSEEGPAQRRSMRRQVVVPGEGRQTVDEALRREDGLVYVL